MTAMQWDGLDAVAVLFSGTKSEPPRTVGNVVVAFKPYRRLPSPQWHSGSLFY
jgi:hypothetical protein